MKTGLNHVIELLSSIKNLLAELVKLANALAEAKMQKMKPEPLVGDPSLLLSREEAAVKINVSLRTFDRLKNEGTITAVRIGNTDFYRLEDLQQAYQISIKKGRI